MKVSVYYESLCPDSIRFLTNQFTPVYNQLGSSNIEVDFLPYGKATVSVTMKNFLFPTNIYKLGILLSKSQIKLHFARFFFYLSKI